MTDRTTPKPTLHLAAGLDRALAWREGGSVRHLVADLSATGPLAGRTEMPAINLAIAIDVSGSMAGEKLVEARRAADGIARALGPNDRLTLVAFDSDAELLLDARPMDALGLAAATAAIGRLESRGQTNLFAGWLLGVERLATAMADAPRAASRIVLLSDGQANQGVTEPAELAAHAGELLARGILTSAVGIGDGYAEAVLGGMAEAGGGRLHDVEHAESIAEVVMGELREGRGAVLERVGLRVVVPASIRAEVIGPWAHTVLPGAIDVVCGTLLPGQTRRVVVRLHCPAGSAGDVVLVGVGASGRVPDADRDAAADVVEAPPAEVELRLADGHDNNAQPRDLERSIAVIQAWQAAVLRKSVRMNRDGDRRATRRFIESELHWLERYGRDVPGAEPFLAELVLLLRRAEEEWDERTRKEVYTAAYLRGRIELEAPRAVPRPALPDVLRGKR
jgi:Ca-activated chloride channel family protein